MVDNPHVESTAGRWVLVERELKLLAIGDRIFHGTSLRRTLDERGRKLLIPAFKDALETGEGKAFTAVYEGQSYAIIVNLIRSPNQGELVAMLGLQYPVDSDREPDPEPTIGSWEWKVDIAGEARAITTYWDEAMYSIYDLESENEKSPAGAWPTPEWFNAVIVPEDRARMRLLIDEGIDVKNRNLHSIVYSVFTGYGQDQMGTRRLRLAGRADQGANGCLWLRGITHEAVTDTSDFTPGLRSGRTDGFLRAAFELARDSALAAVDTQLLEVYMTSPGWRRMGLPRLPDGSVTRLLHPDDLDDFQHYLDVVANRNQSNDEWKRFRLATRAGGYAEYDTLATPAQSVSGGGARYVLVKFSLNFSEH